MLFAPVAGVCKCPDERGPHPPCRAPSPILLRWRYAGRAKAIILSSFPSPFLASESGKGKRCVNQRAFCGRGQLGELLGQVVGADEILEFGEAGVELQFHDSGRAVALLAD